MKVLVLWKGKLSNKHDLTNYKNIFGDTPCTWSPMDHFIHSLKEYFLQSALQYVKCMNN